MRKKKNMVILSVSDLDFLEDVINRGKVLASVRKRAICLKDLHEGLSYKEASLKSGLSFSAVARIAKRYMICGLEEILYGAEKARRVSRYTDADEAELVALACSEPPEGYARWTCVLLAEVLSVQIGKSIKRTKINMLLKKRGVNLGSIKCGALAP
jgi:putative transposase